MSKKLHAIFDCELIGKKTPLFLTCVKIFETGEEFKFWHHKRGHTVKLEKMLKREDLTWVGFNSENFDRPLIAAAIMGHDEHDLKTIAQAIIDEEMRSWQTYREFNIDFIEYDHIDLMEVPPGVKVSLKRYMGRMGYKTMIDLPFHHDHDMNPSEQKLCETYCLNDLGGTSSLMSTVRKELDLRIDLGEKYGIDLRSKSDAQCAEAILKKQLGIKSGEKFVPRAVSYNAPAFIQTGSTQLQELISLVESTEFEINRANGMSIEAEWMSEPLRIGSGTYKFGLGGLHSQHDINLYEEADEKRMISDFDVASYYPNIMMKAGLIPNLGGNRGELFLQEYSEIYEQRIAAKRAGDKRMAGTLKIVLNGVFGKLGNLFCSFYAPDLMLAVTLTGQLNLLCLIYELEQIKGVFVRSANTDGVIVSYPASKRASVLNVFKKNAKRTGFEYEETPYAKIGVRDVNNYVTITEERPSVIIDGKGQVEEIGAKAPEAKRKGAYAKAGVMENVNPTMQICADACAQFLLDGTPIEETIRACKDMSKFVAVREVKGGGVQHLRTETVDDWEGGPKCWTHPGMKKKPITTVKRPAPREVGVGGVPFGRVARWYMTTKQLPAITYCGSGNKVAGTEGGMLCMTLPDKLPKDLDLNWYIAHAYEMLGGLGYETKEFAK